MASDNQIIVLNRPFGKITWYSLFVPPKDVGIHAIPFAETCIFVRLAKHFSEENNDSMVIDIPQILLPETKLSPHLDLDFEKTP